MATKKIPVLLILLVVLTITVVASLYVPVGGIRPNDSCIANLRVIDGAEQRWAIDNKKTTNDTPSWDDIRSYLGLRREVEEVLPQCPQGGKYILGKVGEGPRCSLSGPHHSLPH